MTGQTPRHIDVALIQSVPFACLNRDDTNAIKTLEYGGATRIRTSSQHQKRPIRLDVERSLGAPALRTRRLAESISRRLADQHGWPAHLADKAALHVVCSSSVGAEPPAELTGTAKKPKAQKTETPKPWLTKAIVFFPETGIDDLVEIAVKHRAAIESAPDLLTMKAPEAKDAAVLPKDEIDEVLRKRNGVIALFGRMLAEVDHAGVDGAVAVAHSLTTHQAEPEIDYFGAVDDITALWKDSAGSAHMNTSEYASGTFYRYLTLDLAELQRNLGGDLDAARELAACFLSSAVFTIQGAKRNSTAPFSVPELVHLAVRADRPYSYVGAFEKPISAAPDGGYLLPSIAEYADYALAVGEFLGARRTPVYQGHSCLQRKDLQGLGEHVPAADDLIDKAVNAAFDDRDPQ